MARNILGGFGDMCQAYEPETDIEQVPEPRLLAGETKKQVLCWMNQGCSEAAIIEMMYFYDWFSGMTDSTVDRWKAVISARYEQDRAIIAQAAELENYHDGY